MSINDFLSLPRAVQIVVVVMLWPAIWAGIAIIVTSTMDARRRMKRLDPLHSRQIAWLPKWR